MSLVDTASAAGERLEAGLAQLKAGDSAAAEQCLGEALAFRPGDPIALYLLGVIRLQANDLDGAERLFSAVLSAMPRHAPSWLALGSIRARLGAAAGAVEAYAHFVDLEPTSALGWTALTETRLAAGDVDGAVNAGRNATRLAPQDAKTHIALAAAFAKLARASEAATSYRAALAHDENSTPARLGLALALLQLNQPEAALPEAERALALDAGLPLGWFALGLAARGLGDLDAARCAFTRAVQLDSRLTAAQSQLGSLYDELDNTLASECAWLAVVAENPADLAALVALSTLYCRADRFDLGRQYAERALGLDPDEIGAHRNLALIEAKEGRVEEAKLLRDRAYGACNLYAMRSAKPIRNVLVLAGSDHGNSPDRYLLPIQRYSRYIWFVEYANDKQFSDLPRFDVVFNAIADPDGAAVGAPVVEKFLRDCGRPVLNPPDKIARTARNLAPALFKEIRGLIVPKTARFTSQTRANTCGLRAPVIIRPLRSHGGAGMELIESVDALDARFQAMTVGEERYGTEYYDYRGADGLFRKYRMFFVDRRPYPYHLAISNHWLVHYDHSHTADHPERLAEERRFLEDPEATLGKAALQTIRAVALKLDLEFGGFDFALTAEGDVLLFEANATMLVHPERRDGPLAHKNASTGRILEAFWSMLEAATPKLAA